MRAKLPVIRSQAEKEETVRSILEELAERARHLPEPPRWQITVIDKIFRDLKFMVKPKGFV